VDVERRALPVWDVEFESLGKDMRTELDSKTIPARHDAHLDRREISPGYADAYVGTILQTCPKGRVGPRPIDSSHLELAYDRHADSNNSAPGQQCLSSSTKASCRIDGLASNQYSDRVSAAGMDSPLTMSPFRGDALCYTQRSSLYPPASQ
jgi:hypothetical protein